MSIASDVQAIIDEVLTLDLVDDALSIDSRDLIDDLVGGTLIDEAVAQSMTYHQADVSQTYDPETGDMTAGSGSTPTFTAPAISGAAQTMTYHSALAATSETYDPETGDFISSPGDGALWFDDEDNSHWVGWGL